MATYTRKFLGTANSQAYKDLIIWDNKVSIYDVTAGNDARFMQSSDGDTWTELFSIPGLVGDRTQQNKLCGVSLAEYSGDLYIPQQCGADTNARLLKWDGVSITDLLTSVNHDNLMVHNLVTWAGKLWFITDQTPFVGNNRRVVYQYDGTTFTAIIDYDGAAFLAYNIANRPIDDIKHRTSKLFVHQNRLYFFAAYYTGANWSWEVWILNANGTEFNQIAATDDGYALSAVVDFEGLTYVVVNQLSGGGNPTNPAKVYSSPDMITWTDIGTIADLGFPYGELVFRNKFFISCYHNTNHYTKAYFFDKWTGGFDEETTLMTNVSAPLSGAMIDYKDNLYLGKFKEIYSRSIPPPGGGGKGTIPVIVIRWKDPAGGIIFRYYAPYDVRSPNIFYDGRILNISGINRAIDDKTGLRIIGNMTLELANTDKEFSKLLATHFLKNQIIEVYHGWQNQPHSELSLITRMIVENYSLHGSVFKIECRDASEAYFKKEVPFSVTTVEDFPNIFADHKGLPPPDILGLNSITTGSTPGALEALYTDTAAFEYCASYGTLHSVTQVYSANILKATPADYSIVYRDGYTFIDFVADQGDNSITFNCTGYSVVGWNSANGYIQNPAYIILYFLNQIMEVPGSIIDYDSFNVLAQFYEDSGWGESGKLPLDTLRNPEDVIREMLFSFGCVLYMDRAGQFVVKIKDKSEFTATKRIFEQIDLLSEADRTFGLMETVNHVKANWNYFTAPSVYANIEDVSRDPSIEDYDTKMEPRTPWNYPWNLSEDFVNVLIQAGLDKFAYGDKKISFPLPIHWINDLEIFENFRYQDPWGISASGAGEPGRYYYIEALNYDLQSGKIQVTAIDLQWLAGQYFILGDRDILAAAWPSATEADRFYGYLGDRSTGLFSTGEPNKKLGDRNL